MRTPPPQTSLGHVLVFKLSKSLSSVLLMMSLCKIASEMRIGSPFNHQWLDGGTIHGLVVRNNKKKYRIYTYMCVSLVRRHAALMQGKESSTSVRSTLR